ncbi:MAG: hemolysin family protein [Prevotellaceae bacterium]|jgi:CBS domain containing-hemolysin-like protein|nr:hemolysin family protein [Prevotellaceae bacterium]
MSFDLWMIALTLLFSAFCSGMEIAYLSSNKLKIEIDRQQGSLYTYFAQTFLHNQGQFITTILVGNNVALVIYGMLMSGVLNATITHDITSPGTQLLATTLISTAIIIFVAEFAPKAICRLQPNFFLRIFSFPAYAMFWVFYPIAKFTTWLAVFILKHMLRQNISGPQRAQHYFDIVDLQNLTNEASEANEEGEEELEHDIKIFQNALDFSEVKVRECMVPRTDIEAIDMEDSVEDLRKLFVETGFSRILVYKNSIDNIIGYVKSSYLFKGYKSMHELLLDLEFVPETMPAQKLLSLFIKKRKSIAVVVDEFGGTAGMVTMEDIMEEIFGEIEDEHDVDDLLEKKIADNEYVFAGRLEVSYLNEEYDLNIPESDEYETLAGFIIYASENIPKSGEEIRVKDFNFRILRTSASKIELVHLTVMPERKD